MNRLLQNRLVLQWLLTSVAAISLAILSVVLITDAIRNAEGVVLGEANKNIAAAIAELKLRYQDRASSDTPWLNLPAPARDISLRALTQTVLRAYPGIEGGFYSGTDFLGYGFPTHDTGNAKTDVPLPNAASSFRLPRAAVRPTARYNKSSAVNRICSS